MCQQVEWWKQRVCVCIYIYQKDMGNASFNFMLNNTHKTFE